MDILPNLSLESALRQFAVLSKGDMIEITYNSMTFEFLIMEITPEGPGISVIDTDLEVSDGQARWSIVSASTTS